MESAVSVAHTLRVRVRICRHYRSTMPPMLVGPPAFQLEIYISLQNMLSLFVHFFSALTLVGLLMRVQTGRLFLFVCCGGRGT
uniref:Uncharacterized protein n=1 Tax=Acanthochromis polyacanthus TaxID=80966 RepID=A0A3Q1GW91_9TELE